MESQSRQIPNNDAHIRHRGPKINTHFGQEDGVDLRTVLEVLQDPHALHLASAAVDVQLSELLGICLARSNSNENEWGV